MEEITKGKEAVIPREPKILIVEDDPVIQLLHQRILGNYGLKADLAENGIQALQLIKLHEYDLIISDVLMPEMGGVELLNEIGAFKPRLVDKIIFCTATMNEDLETHPLRSRFTVLQKPVEQEQFIKTVFGLLNKVCAN